MLARLRRRGGPVDAVEGAVVDRVRARGAVEGPAGERPRELVDVGVDVADRQAGAVLARGNQRHFVLLQRRPEVVDRTERVQLDHLARVVLVEARRAVDVVVEVIQHRRGRERLLQQLAEIAERVAAHDVAAPAAPGRRGIAVVARHVEVVVPEVDHALEQLPARIDRAHEQGALAFSGRIVAHVRLATARIAIDLVIGPQLRERLAERGVRRVREARVDLGIGHVAAAVGAGGKLLVDEGDEARVIGRTERVEVRDRVVRAGARSVPEPSEHVHRERRRQRAARKPVDRGRGLRGRRTVTCEESAARGRAGPRFNNAHACHPSSIALESYTVRTRELWGDRRFAKRQPGLATLRPRPIP